MFGVQDDDILKLQDDLEKAASKAIPFATRFTLNTAAKKGRREGIKNVKRDMILRNDFTKNSIQFQPTGELKISRQQTFIGSTEDYMERQEFGGTVMAKGKHGVPLATTEASGEGRGVQPRRKGPTMPNTLRRIRINNKKGSFKSKSQEFFFKIQQAVKSKSKYVFLETSRKKAIYRVEGSIDTRDRIQGLRLDMMWDLSHKTVNTPRSPWLKPAFDETTKKIPEIYKKALEFQLKRRGLFEG